jgi:hypothetical protein
VELFTIQCTTCRARLKVKDESVIGDILSCPKCSSMVQVVPPPGWSSSQIPASSTTAPSSSAISLPAVPIPVRKAAASVPPALPAAAASLPVGTAVLAPARPAAPPIALVAPPIVPAMTDVARSASQPAGARQDVWIYAGGLAAGVLAGALVWVVFGPRDEPVSVAQQASIQQPMAQPAAAAIAATDGTSGVTEPRAVVAQRPLTTDHPQPVETAQPVAIEPTVEAPPSQAAAEEAHPAAPATAESPLPPTPAIKL